MSDDAEKRHCEAVAAKVCHDRWLQGESRVEGLTDREYFAGLIAKERTSARSEQAEELALLRELKARAEAVPYTPHKHRLDADGCFSDCASCARDRMRDVLARLSDLRKERTP